MAKDRNGRPGVDRDPIHHCADLWTVRVRSTTANHHPGDERLMADTYEALKDEIIEWALPDGEPKFNARVPDFIRLAEARFDRELRTHNMIGVAEIRTIEPYIQVPPDWLETISIAVKGNPALPSLTIVQQQEFARASPVSPPWGFAMIDGGFKLFPTPAAECLFEIIYYRRVERLSDTNEVNW